MIFCGFIFILLQIIISCDGARILAVAPSPSYSHQVVFQPIWKELSLRGHQVTTITPDPIKDPSLTNLTEIDLHYLYDASQEMKNEVMAEIKESYWKMFITGYRLMTNITDLVLQNPAVQNLIKDKQQTFDIVMLEYGSPAMFAFGERFSCPIICVISLDGFNSLQSLMGNPTHPVLNPTVGFPVIGKLNFKERLTSFFFNIFEEMVFNYVKPEIQEVVNKHFGDSASSLDNLMSRIDMAFFNTDPVLHPVRPLVPAVVQIGAGIHIRPPKALPKNIQTYLDSATDGAIYFSLGSNARSIDLSVNTMNAILKTLGKLPYKVLWKFEDEMLPGKPDNVMIIKWAPQQDILRHPNIKLFISQCGLQSTDESLYSRVPMLGMPMFGDQSANAKLIELKGFGLSINHGTMTEEEFTSKILELIQNPKYRKRVRELADLAQDQPMTGLEKAVWWTEYVLRHKGAKHLRSPALDIPAYQYYLLDVFGVCALVLMIIVFVFYKVICLVCSLKYFKGTRKIKDS